MSLNPPAKGLNSLAVCPSFVLWLLLGGCQPVIWSGAAGNAPAKFKEGLHLHKEEQREAILEV
jgi:hypothetical protein